MLRVGGGRSRSSTTRSRGEPALGRLGLLPGFKRADQEGAGVRAA